MRDIQVMKKKIKILSVFSMIDRAREFNWYAKYIDKDRFELIGVFLNPFRPSILDVFRENGHEVIWIKYNGKRNMPAAIFRLYRIFKRQNPDIVHAQLFDASYAGMLAARLAGIKNRIHTRHHGILHHEYFPNSVKHDLRINKWSTKIIAPSMAVCSILIEKENVDIKKIVHINHGFDFNELLFSEKDSVKLMKEKYRINGFPVIGAVSRFTEWKGLQYTIRAFKGILTSYPDAVLVLTNEGGDYKKQIEEELSKIPDKNFRVIGFEPEMPALFKTFDLFIHVPVNSLAESFGQVYIEAIALGVPSVFTKSGIACEIEDLESIATIVPYRDVPSIVDAIHRFVAEPGVFISRANSKTEMIIKTFGFSEKIRKTEELYLQMTNGEC